MQSPKPMQYILYINTISKFEIKGGIFLSILQRLSYLTTAFSHYFTKRFSHNVFLQNYFLNVYLTTSFSRCLSQKVFFLTTTFQQCFSYNVFLTTILSQCLYNNVFLKTTFSQRLSHNVFLTTS